MGAGADQAGGAYEQLARQRPSTAEGIAHPYGLAPGLSSLRPSWRRASAGIGPVAAPLSAPIPMAMLSAAASPFCRPEEDPFLLLESTLRSMEEILLSRRGLPLRRTWIEQPYGEEEITILEEEVIPAIQQCLARVDELDERLLAQQELLQRCQLEAERDALGELRLQMA
jgi:hypothetical protein